VDSDPGLPPRVGLRPAAPPRALMVIHTLVAGAVLWLVALSSGPFGLTISLAVVALVALGAAALLWRRDTVERAAASHRLELLFSQFPDLLVTADTAGHFRDVNPVWQKVFGFTADELKTKPFLDFVHPDDVARTLAMYAEQQAGGEAVAFANRYRCKDGSYRWLEWNATPVSVGDLIYAMARDVTERRAAEEKIRALTAQLEEHVASLEAVNAELEAFSYSVSHDLRAPLRHIVGFADLLEQRAAGALDEQGRRYLAKVRSAAQRMGALIDDLLAFSRLGRAELRATDVSLDEVVRSAAAEVQEELAGRDVDLRVRPLPAVRGDPGLLRLALVNLLSNAVKYTRPRPRAEIELGAEPGANGDVVVFVRDNGVGFDMKYADKLFGVFQRLHSADQFEGTGIGLANVQRIVHRHGGRVWGEGRPDAGATFYLSLPAAGREASL
jgi:PAS domain S-box-containing protein